MTPVEIIKQAEADGVTLSLSPTGTIKAVGIEDAVNRWLPVIRGHKAELLDELLAANDGVFEPLIDPKTETRRQRVLRMLQDSPGVNYAAVTDTDSDPDNVILSLAVRGKVTCELLIPRDRYDGVLLLDLIEKHSATMH